MRIIRETVVFVVSLCFAAAANGQSVNGHEYVDLGLSVKWATCNVGASSPEDYGDYFAWGETSTKSSYDEDNSRTYKRSRYNDDISGNANLDAARTLWGGSWRLPTKAEARELKDKCTWTRTTQGGTKGYKVTGPNGRSIFFPVAGCRDGSSPYFVGSGGCYWTSTPDESDADLAYGLYFDDWDHVVGWSRRCEGLSIRPVSK